MKYRSWLVWIPIAFVAILGAAYLYILIPRSIGEVRVDGLTLMPGEVMTRLNETYLRDGDRPRRMLRVELSSSADLLARAEAVGGRAPLYASVTRCPLRSFDTGMPTTRGPYPDDLPRYANAEMEERHAGRGRDGRYRYTVYVAADDPAMTQGNLCLKLRGSWYFSPHAESGAITIPAQQIRRAAGS